MPSYNLTNTQRDILTTWLFEPVGWMDFAKELGGPTAREVWALDPANFDLVDWVRSVVPEVPEENSEAAFVWWIRANDQVNITPPNRPPETAEWVAIAQGWDDSINAGFARASQAERNVKSVEMFDENQQVTGTVPAGAHLAQQQQIISKVLSVLT